MIYRDYYYQCLFAGMQFLAEVGCRILRIENPRTGYLWQEDSLLCLMEAKHNINRHVDSSIRVHLLEEEIDRSLDPRIEALVRRHGFENHTPIGIAPRIEHGLNWRTVFVEGGHHMQRQSHSN